MSKFSASLPVSGSVVATVPTPAALRLALRLKPRAVDYLELRLDHFADDPAPLLKAAPQLQKIAPLLITARHPSEGGQHALDAKRRATLYRDFLPFASLVDIEVRSAKQLAAVIGEAKTACVGVVLSFHDFKKMPEAEELCAKGEAAFGYGADVFKFAVTPRSYQSLLELGAVTDFLCTKIPTAAMGMGPWGKLSRLLLARGGSVLNYGYLDQPNAPGQWPAKLLKERLVELAD